MNFKNLALVEIMPWHFVIQSLCMVSLCYHNNYGCMCDVVLYGVHLPIVSLVPYA